MGKIGKRWTWLKEGYYWCKISRARPHSTEFESLLIYYYQYTLLISICIANFICLRKIVFVIEENGLSRWCLKAYTLSSWKKLASTSKVCMDTPNKCVLFSSDAIDYVHMYANDVRFVNAMFWLTFTSIYRSVYMHPTAICVIRRQICRCDFFGWGRKFPFTSTVESDVS